MGAGHGYRNGVAEGPCLAEARRKPDAKGAMTPLETLAEGPCLAEARRKPHRALTGPARGLARGLARGPERGTPYRSMRLIFTLRK